MKQKAFLALAILEIILVSGCVQQVGLGNKKPSGERMFVETDVKPANSIWNNTAIFPRKYGFIQNNEVVMQLKATKYMSNTDGLMTI